MLFFLCFSILCFVRSAVSNNLKSTANQHCNDPNASPENCPRSCQPTCEQPDTSEMICTAECLPSGCVCNLGYILNKPRGICIKVEDCPSNQQCSDPNASPENCPRSCQPTCEQPDTSDIICTVECLPSGCVCNLGYILNKPRGICIKTEDCPCKCNQQCSDGNASPENCPRSCQPTCEQPDTSDMICTAECLPSGCVCNLGYILNKPTGICIKIGYCPSNQQCSDPNASPENCPRSCQPTCEQPDTSDMICTAECLPSGCVCNLGYILNKPTGICIKIEDCPSNQQCSDPNASPENCPRSCQPTCEQPDTSDMICTAECLPSGCVCNLGYILNKPRGICIKIEDCPCKSLQCGLNEVAVKCRTICPPQNCEIAYTDYNCAEYKNICEPGCDCLPNYLRNGSGICIPNSKCSYPTSPICGVNEIARDCRKICPPQTCQGRLALVKCRSDIPCEPGCDCVPNYLRNSQGVCVHVDKCDSCEPEKISVSNKCIRTCARPNPPNCPYQPAKTDIDGCKCKEGYILSRLIGGKCIKIEDCPRNVTCNGDPHARAKRCPLPCPSTCHSPNATPCKKACEPIGCECEPGYLHSKEGGKCVLPEECPGGDPCPKNSVFSPCRYNCPQDYCPVDDETNGIVCDPWPICLSGCVCRLNHRRLSYENDTCIVASDCPPVDCIGPNEVWCGCPSECFSGKCEDRQYQDAPCNTLVLNCQPKCICERDTFRNASGDCVPASECPPLYSGPDV